MPSTSSNSPFRRRLQPVLAVALAASLGGVALATPTGASAAAGQSASSSRAGGKTPTRFAFKSVSYGSRLQGGQVPAGSDTTSYNSIGCTNKAGINRSNTIADVNVPGVGTLSGVKTRNWTRKKDSTVSSFATHDIAEVVLAQGDSGKLVIQGVTSKARAFHTNSGFRATTHTSVARIVFRTAGAAPMEVEVPTSPGQPVVVPGVASISLGHEVKRAGNGGAYAAADALDITLIPTDTRVRIAHSAAKLNSGIKRGVFSGNSNATRVNALDKNVKSGPQPLSIMPCQGTRGKVRTKSLAHVDLGGQVVVGAVSSRELGRQTEKFAKGFEEGRVASVDFGNGQLVLKGIVGRANVKRFRSTPQRNANGTTVGSITSNGNAMSLPDLDGFEIPNLLRVQTRIVKKSTNGIDVTSVRIKLLDGTGATINLGQAHLAIRGSGLK